MWSRGRGLVYSQEADLAIARGSKKGLKELKFDLSIIDVAADRGI